MEYLLAAVTDVGFRKEINQDSVLIKTAFFGKDKVVLAVVCDGMGGLQKGEAASATLVCAFKSWFQQSIPTILKSQSIENSLFHSWNELLKNVNQKLNRYGAIRKITLGTTVTALLFYRGICYIAHIGDCRAYGLKKRISQLTKDQTLVQREIEAGRLTPEEAKRDPRRNVLLQCVGACTDITPEFKREKLAKDTLYLICSDGFRHAVSNEELLSALSPRKMKTEKQMQDCLWKVVQTVKRRGESDDISAVAICLK